jgi:hypothetical protein
MELGCRVQHGELVFDDDLGKELSLFVSSYVEYPDRSRTGSDILLFVRKIDWVSILGEYATDSIGWDWGRYNHLLATIDA